MWHTRYFFRMFAILAHILAVETLNTVALGLVLGLGLIIGPQNAIDVLK